MISPSLEADNLSLVKDSSDEEADLNLKKGSIDKSSYFSSNQALNKRKLNLDDNDLNKFYQKSSEKTFQENIFNISEALKIFKINQSVIKDLNYLSKFEIEIINYENSRALNIIKNSFRIFYLNLEKSIDLDESFVNVCQNSARVKDVFQKPYEMYQDLALFVIKNFIVNLNLEEYFDSDELYHKKLFFEFS